MKTIIAKGRKTSLNVSMNWKNSTQQYNLFSSINMYSLSCTSLLPSLFSLCGHFPYISKMNMIVISSFPLVQRSCLAKTVCSLWYFHPSVITNTSSVLFQPPF